MARPGEVPAGAQSVAERPLAFLLVDGHQLPVDAMWVDRGRLVLQANVVGPLADVDAFHYAVSGRDGVAVFRGPGRVRWANVGARDTLTVTVETDRLSRPSP